MTLQPTTRSALVLTALTLLGQAGCLSFCHPIEPVTSEKVAVCKEIPQSCRSHVYVFFIHGMDPLDFANLSGVRDYVQSLGFIKTYYGQLYHTIYFTDEMREIHQRDPEARFALVGFSFGANMVRDVANAVRPDGVDIDLIVYLGGNTLTNSEEDRPPNVGHIVNILATGWIWNGTTLDNAENINYDNVWHFGSPSHPQTLEVLTNELTDIACRVAFVEYGYPSPDAPHIPISEKPDEWDFLASNHQVPPLPPKELPARTQSRDPMANK